MTIEEFSNEFDVLLDSYSKGQITLNEYEKSIFLTQAQDTIVLTIYNGKNSLGDSFEKTEEVREYLRPLVKTVEITQQEQDVIGLSDISYFYKLPSDLWFITQESVDINKNDCSVSTYLDVVPITQDNYHKLKNNPFRGVSNSRILRLDVGEHLVELISKFPIKLYRVRYLSEPEPIILTPLSYQSNIESNIGGVDLSIKGKSDINECKLNPVLHRNILEKAVALAIASRTNVTTK